MKNRIDRRDFLKLAGLGGAVFASGLGYSSGSAARTNTAPQDFYFVQLSDTHWGFSGPQVNPDAGGTLQKAVAAVNALRQRPDFVVFTGDLTHTTDDPVERRRRLGEFRDIVANLKVKDVKFMPGEHDASLDHGKAYREFFGDPYYAFDHKGIHFIVLDNVSDPSAMIGEEQLAWLKTELDRLDRQAPIVVLTHRPLFDLYPQWDWATRDGARAIELLMPYANVTVFYGHIHQEHHQMTGHIAHHAARSLIFPLPAPGSMPKRMPLPWDPNEPYKGLGFREVDAEVRKNDFRLTEFPVKKA
ncbi:MAG TPA: metallophosphoesterase [Burkholderiales bacterium]